MAGFVLFVCWATRTPSIASAPKLIFRMGFPLARLFLLRLREGADIDFALRVRQRPKLGGDAARDGGGFAGRLEACEIGTVAPGEGSAQAFSRCNGGVVNGVAQQ